MAVVLHTTCGDLPILLYCKSCPAACFNFLALCASDYYDGCSFYRHFRGILLQTGDPTNTGKGGDSIYAHLPSAAESTATTTTTTTSSISPPSDFTCSILPGRYFNDEGFGETNHQRRGVIAMAHKGTKANSNASQFFVLLNPQPTFDGVYTAFGCVDLNGCFHPDTGKVETAPLPSSCDADLTREGATGVSGNGNMGNSGDSVLRSIEAAASDVDGKSFVKNRDAVRILSTTVLYNPFAEGRLTI